MNLENLARYELKYAVHPDLIGPMRDFIRPYCALDKHGCPEKDGFYTIDSLYFDTANYRYYRDVEDKAPVRAKLRVRTYPDTPCGIVKFEIKRRQQDLIIKSSAVAPKDGWAALLHGSGSAPGMTPRTREVMDVFRLRMRTEQARPKMLVRYERQAFVGAVDENIRVTFDRGMVYQRMERFELEGWPNFWMPMDDPESMGVAGHVLLELKFKDRAPLWMAGLIHRFGLVRQGYSKYCASVRRGVMETGRYWDLMPAMSGGGQERTWIF